MRLVVTFVVLVGALAAALVLLAARDDAPDAAAPDAPAIAPPPGPAASPAADAPAKRRRSGTTDAEPADTIDEDAPVVRGALRVRVASVGDDAPVAGARVVAEDAEGGTHEAVTGADGAAVFDPPIDSDYVRFLVTAAGCARGRAFADKERMREGGTVRVALAAGADVEGVVLDADTGAAILGATVRAPGERGDDAIEATTDGAGFFRLVSVPSVRELDLAFEEPLHLRVEVRWRPSASRIEVRLAAAGCIRGVVKLDDGSPAGWARVVAELVHDEKSPYHGSRTAVADAKGVYLIGGVPLGTAWTLSASKPGTGLAPASPPVRVDAGRREGVADFTLRPTVTVDVYVLRPDGSPAAGARVWVRNAGARHAAPPCGANGMRRVEGLAPYCSTVRVEATGFPPREYELDLSAAGAARRLDARLEAGEVVSGVVVDDRGSAVRGAAVSVRGRGAELPVTAETDAAGRFRAEGIAQGACVVSATADHHVDASLETQTAPASDLRVVIARCGRVRFELPTGHAARSRSLDVHLLGNPRSFESRPVAAGAGGADMECEPGEYTLLIHAPGFARFVATATVSPGETVSLGALDLSPGIVLAGRVRDTKGAAVEGAEVVAVQRDDAGKRAGPFEQATTDSEGLFRLADLGVGRWDLRISSDSTFDQSLDVDVRADPPDVAVTLQRPGTFVCKVLERDEPVGGLEVSVAYVTGGDPDEASSTTDRSGAASFRWMKPGRLRASVPRQGADPIVVEAEVREGETTEVTVTR